MDSASLDTEKLNFSNHNSAKNGLRYKKFKKKARGVIYISHIPHGFYEDEMRAYFSQFGKVRATSVARSRKTGRSKGYGFVEFDDEEVAKIAAETMNNYLMYNRIIKCKYIPPEERKNKMFLKPYIAGDYQRKKNRIIDSKNKTNALSNLCQNAYLKKARKKINKFRKFFKERGIDFNFMISSDTLQDKYVMEKNKTNTSSIKGLKIEPKRKTGDQLVLEIDESDHEISFKTPPQVKKVIKKSLNPSNIIIKKPDNENLQTGKKVKLNNFKSSNKKILKKDNTKKKNQKNKTKHKIRNKT